MSIECDTRRPPPSESLDDRGKRLKSEPEPEPEPEPKVKRKPEPEPLPIWETKAIEDLKLSDFSMYDDDTDPFMFMCVHFTYRNKAQIKKDIETAAAVADYKHRSRNLSVFDAITPPKIDGRCWDAVPLSMTEASRLTLTPLCKLALDKYNAENQDANFMFLDIVKTTWSAVGMYYMTFQAQNDSPNCPATTFQAQVFRKRTGPHEVISCCIKT
ncbi:hypothetical protein TSUD_19940 [Trifolium subterraneum]|uniref:Cystatin domain-containing protein n=1 Tax=Trifolium subterraneum TaxID=3900 RepID=A0A2Z6NRP9_TRISU|nr:hypothetical protein TSUD_19940 [Trifolium subterraneum]